MKYRCKYEYERRYGDVEHVWYLIGAKGGIHLRITDRGKDCNYDERYIGGIGMHWRNPPDYMASQPPSQDHCWLLQAPCWHDSSSLQVMEIWIPLWLTLYDDYDAMFEELERYADEKFEEGVE